MPAFVMKQMILVRCAGPRRCCRWPHLPSARCSAEKAPKASPVNRSRLERARLRAVFAGVRGAVCAPFARRALAKTRC